MTPEEFGAIKRRNEIDMVDLVNGTFEYTQPILDCADLIEEIERLK